jgi:death-on-curing protein
MDASDVIAIHDRLVGDFGAARDPIGPGLRSRDLLESALGRQDTGFQGERKYWSLADRVASTFYGIAMNHAFFDGNKRTALVAMLCMLDAQNHWLEIDEKELFDFTVKMVEHKLVPGARDVDAEVTAVSQWIAAHSRKVDRRSYPLTQRRLAQILTSYGVKRENAKNANAIIFRKGRLTSHVHYDGEGVELTKDNVRSIRRDLHLDEEHGVDSTMFFSREDVVDDFITRYRATLRALSSYDKQSRW